MNTFSKHPLVIILLSIAIMYFPSVVSAEDKWCWLEATIERTYVYVTELDEDGANETILWEGWIEQGERQKIKSAQGQISYDYRLASDGRTYGDNSADCDNGNSVRIP
jgi:hypothetical protein